MATTKTKAATMTKATKAGDNATDRATMRLTYRAGETPVHDDVNAVKLEAPPVMIQAADAGVCFALTTGQSVAMTWSRLAELVASGELKERWYGVVVAGTLDGVYPPRSVAKAAAREAREMGRTALVIGSVLRNPTFVSQK